MNKEDLVGVVYSPKYGGNIDSSVDRLDTKLVELVLWKNFPEIQKYIKTKYPKIYTSNVLDFKVEWLPQKILNLL